MPRNFVSLFGSGGDVLPVAAGGGAASILQSVLEKAQFNGSTNATDAVTINGVIAGSTLVVFLTHSNAQVTSGVNDGSAYTNKTTVTDTADSQITESWVLQNAGAGTHVITATAAGVVQFWAIRVVEVGNAAAASYDGGVGAFQEFPGTAGDGLASTNITTTANGDLILGWILDMTATAVPGLGTGFSSFATDATIADLLEYLTQGAAGLIQATGQAINNVSHDTHIVAIKHA